MEENNKMFQKLTPVDSVDINIYEEALDYVFQNKDVKNVAVTGAYSAGKSSVIETYKKIKDNKKFIHISLANFDTPEYTIEELPKTSNKNNVGANVLEGKILNQLIHQIDAKNIPQTNFRVKRTVSKIQSIIQTICIILLCIFTLYCFNFYKWKTFLDKLSIKNNFLEFTATPNMLFITSILVICILGYFLFYLIQFQKNKNLLKKVSVNGNEIEIFEQNDDSYFDKYLNEVLYLFEKSEADVIVFEDMDRYNMNNIFQRLREVNVLVNKKREKNNDVPLRFFYLVRDDIFVSKDRTKFFDFIIPIVPVLDASNSYDQFIEHFKAGGIFDLFDENFLQGISLYVDDMRMLKNIYNEFVIYYTRIGTLEQNANKLLALIVYKNIFPRDFSELQLNQGFVYTLLASKHKFVEETKLDLQKKIEEHNYNINQMHNEVLNSKEEIDFVYTKYKDYYGRIKEQYAKERDLRKERLEAYSNGEEEKIKESIRCIEDKIIRLDNMKLSEIIDRDNIDNIFKTVYINEIGYVNDFNEIKGSEYFDLLKYLIRNGYIDETYSDYMTYFYENSLSRVDKVFLRSIADQKAKEYTYELRNPSLVISRLNIVDFDKEEILNFDLLSHILKNITLYNDYVKRLIYQLKNKKLYNFILSYIESKRNCELFVQAINQYWSSFFRDMLNESKYSEENKIKIAQLCLCATAEDDLSRVNEQNVLSNYISNQKDFLKIEDINIEVLIDKMKYLNICFKEIDFSISNNLLLREVYDNNLYELNWNMIESILQHFYNLSRSDEFERRNLTLIFSNCEQSLVDYIRDNINVYVSEMLAHSKGRIYDAEDVVLYVLNNDSIDFEYKKEYIDSLLTKINILYNVKDKELWSCIIDNELLVYSEDNVLRYFNENDRKYDETLIRYINKFMINFCYDSNIADEKYGDKFSSVFFNATVKCNEIYSEKYELILFSMNRYYTSFAFENISFDKIEILIKLRIIRISLEVLLFMRENYPEQVISLIVKNYKEYTDSVIDDDNFIFEELLDILNTDIETEYKIKLLGYTNKPITITNKMYDDEVGEYILKYNFDKKDLPYILKNYDKLLNKSQTIVKKLVLDYIDVIYENKYAVSYKLLMEIMTNDSISATNKLEMLAVSVGELSYVQCKNCLSEIGSTEYSGLLEGKRPKIEINDISEQMLKSFKEKDWISKYETDDDNYYRAIGRKIHSKK